MRRAQVPRRRRPVVAVTGGTPGRWLTRTDPMAWRARSGPTGRATRKPSTACACGPAMAGTMRARCTPTRICSATCSSARTWNCNRNSPSWWTTVRAPKDMCSEHLTAPRSRPSASVFGGRRCAPATAVHRSTKARRMRGCCAGSRPRRPCRTSLATTPHTCTSICCLGGRAAAGGGG